MSNNRATLNISLSPELDKFVSSKVASGRYLTASEVVREALRLLEEQDRIRELRVKELRSEIELGLQQLDQGQSVDGKEVFEEARERVKLKRNARK